MGWKRTGYQTYLVAWEELGIVKAGYTENKRWRGFQIRGATVYGLWRHSSCHDAIEHETAMETVLAQRGRPAWRLGDRDLAAPILGGRGGGYLECYQIAPHELRLVRAMLLSMSPSTAQASAAHDSHAMHRQTDRQTYRQSGSTEMSSNETLRARGEPKKW